MRLCRALLLYVIFPLSTVMFWASPVLAQSADSLRIDRLFALSDSLLAKENDKALALLQEARQLADQTGAANLQALAAYKLGYALRLNNQLSAAENQYQALRAIAVRQNDAYFFGLYLFAKGDWLFARQKWKEAEDTLLAAMTIADRFDWTELQQKIAFDLAYISQYNQNPKKALYYLKRHVELKDAVYLRQRQEIIAEYQKKFDLNRNEAELEAINRHKQLQESELKWQKMLRNLLIASLALIGLLFVLLFNRFRFIKNANLELQKKDRAISQQMQENEEIKELLKLVEKQKKEIEVQRELVKEANSQVSQAYALLQADVERKTNDLAEARELQLAILPKRPPDFKGVDIAAFMQTATEVGGDFYDFYVPNSQNLHFALGDATGHGLKAAFLVAVAKSYYQFLAPKHSNLELMQQLSKGVSAMNVSDMYLAMMLGRYANRELEIVAAGMPPVYHYSAQTGKAQMIEMRGIFLGTNFDLPYDSLNLKVDVGDMVLIMTDGLPELSNAQDDLFGYERVMEIIANAPVKEAQAVIDELLKAAEEWAAELHFDDDITIIALKILE